MPKAGSSLTYDLLRQMNSPSGFSYTAYDSLYAWYKFDETLTASGELTDYSNNSRGIGPKNDSSSLTPGAPTSDSPFLKSFDRRSINFANDLLVNDNDSDFVLDEGFTVATWIKVDAFSGTHVAAYQGNATGQPETAGEFSFVLKVGKGIYSNPSVDLFIGDASNNGEIYVKSNYIALNTFDSDKWVHVAASYDGGDSPDSISLYLNGEKLGIRDRGENNFTSMTGPSGGRFCVGNSFGASPSYDFDGSYAELAVWSKVLKSSEIYGIYSLSQGAFLPTSGILTNPVRTIIRENDYRTGSYPTNLRTGDPDFVGNRAVEPYNDRNTLDFKTGFPRGKIQIKTGIDSMEGYVFGLTGSNGTTKEFEVIRASIPNPAGGFYGLRRVLNATPVYVNPNKTKLTDSLGMTPGGNRHVAYMLSVCINNDPDLELKAEPVSGSVYMQSINGKRNVDSNGRISVYNPLMGSPKDRDYKVTNFVRDFTTVNAATKLTISSPFDRNNISTPNSLPDIMIEGGILPGISDHGIHFSPGENISPFDDRKYSIGSTKYYEEGTPVSILPGFSSPLSSKTQIVINLSSSNGPNGTGTALYFATGVNGDGAPAEAGPEGLYHPEITTSSNAPGFSYWDDVLKRWTLKKEVVDPPGISLAYTTAGIPLNSLMSYTQARIFGYRGFTAPVYIDHPLSDSSGITSQTLDYYRLTAGEISNENIVRKKIDRLKGCAQPTVSLQFPLGMQYQPSGSQYIEMKNKIATPFLVEKIKVDIDVNLGISSNQDLETIAFRKFFILCQTNEPEGKVPEQKNQIPISETWYQRSKSFLREGLSQGFREIITYGRIGVANVANNYSSSSLYNDLKNSFDAFVTYTGEDQARLGVTSSLSLEIEPRVAEKQSMAGFFTTFSANDYSNAGTNPLSTTAWHYDRDSNPGGPALNGRASGRHLGPSLEASDIDPNNDPLVVTSLDSSTASFFPKKDYFKTSPYMIFPSDKLIIGWENIPEFYSSLQEVKDNAEEMVDRIKNLKITLFGSQVVGGVEHHDTSNQPLTSPGIHEAILGDPVVDKWDVEPLITMTGSIYDANVFGVMANNHEPSGSERGVISSRTKQYVSLRDPNSSNTTAVKITTSSFSRTVPLVDNNVVYYDSAVPPPGAFLSEILPSNTLAERKTVGSVVRYGLQLSTAAGEPTRRAAPFLGLFNDPEINASRNRFLPSNPFLYKGKTSFRRASDGSNRRFINLFFEDRVFSGSFQRIHGVSVGSTSQRQNRSSYTSEPSGSVPLKVVSFASPVPEDLFQNFLIMRKRHRREIAIRETRSLYNTLYGIPKYLSDGSIRFPVRPAGAFGVTDNIEGFKYGLMNTTPVSPVYHFSRTSHGNFRDLMFSPPEGMMRGLYKVLDPEDIVDGKRKSGLDEEGSPVRIRFVSRAGEPDVDPRTTNAQNLHKFSSSSFPYFDEISKDRDVVKSPPPDGDLESYEIEFE